MSIIFLRFKSSEYRSFMISFFILINSQFSLEMCLKYAFQRSVNISPLSLQCLLIWCLNWFRRIKIDFFSPSIYSLIMIIPLISFGSLIRFRDLLCKSFKFWYFAFKFSSSCVLKGFTKHEASRIYLFLNFTLINFTNEYFIWSTFLSFLVTVTF